jgi:hypothetical protein
MANSKYDILKKVFNFLRQNPVVILVIIIAIGYWKISSLESENFDLKYNIDQYKETIHTMETNGKVLEAKTEMALSELGKASRRELKLIEKFNELDSDEKFKDKNPVNYISANADWIEIKSAIDSISDGSTKFP